MIFIDVLILYTGNANTRAITIGVIVGVVVLIIIVVMITVAIVVVIKKRQGKQYQCSGDQEYCHSRTCSYIYNSHLSAVWLAVRSVVYTVVGFVDISSISIGSTIIVSQWL
jgi:hypothetical protein